MNECLFVYLKSYFNLSMRVFCFTFIIISLTGSLWGANTSPNLKVWDTLNQSFVLGLMDGNT